MRLDQSASNGLWRAVLVIFEIDKNFLVDNLFDFRQKRNAVIPRMVKRDATKRGKDLIMIFDCLIFAFKVTGSGRNTIQHTLSITSRKRDRVSVIA